MWNAEKGFMESRNSDGSWAGEDEGWTEGDHWAYSLDVMASFFSHYFLSFFKGCWLKKGGKLA